MRIVLKIILSLVFIFLFLLLVITSTIKLKFLNTSFWQDKYDLTFYQNLVGSLQEEEGDFDLPPTLFKDLFDKNINNIVLYLNGEKSQLLVYIPKQFDLSFSDEEVPLRLILQRYTQLGSDQTLKYIDYAGSTGFYLTIIMLFSIISLVLISLALKRTVGVALIISSILVSLVALALEFIKEQWIRDLVPKKEGIALISVPLMHDISVFWGYIGISTFLLGVFIPLLIKTSKPITKKKN